MPLFGPSFNGTKLKVCLKLCITRLQMLQKKKDNQGVLARKEIAQLLGKNKEELARIRVEQIIRDDYVVEVLEILELYCTLLTSRFGLIEAVKECDPGMLESIQTIMWCAPHLQAEVSELKQIAHAFGVRYGKEFIRQALGNLDDTENAEPGSGKVSARVMHKLTDYTPKASLVDNYLVAIAQTYGVNYIPPIRPPEADLLGGSAIPSASAPTLFDFPSAPLGAAHGPPTDFAGSDYPPGAGAGAAGGGGGAGGGAGLPGIDMLFPSPPGQGGGAGQGPALYPPPMGSHVNAPDLSYLPPAAAAPVLYPPQAPAPAAAQGPPLPLPPFSASVDGIGGVGGNMAQPSVQHFDDQKVPGGFPTGRPDSERPPSFDESQSSTNTAGGGPNIAAAAFPEPPPPHAGAGSVAVGYDSWDVPGAGSMSASVGPTSNVDGPTYAPINAVRPEDMYDGYNNGGASEPTYAEIPGGNLPAVPSHGSMANATYGAQGVGGGPGAAGAGSAGAPPPDFDELARRFQNLRDKSNE